ncbi:MAG: chloride channel protein, partial [Dehalococcoidales bacterium]|nr:chloride channel protein [Dehalococcoidales bacterium]
YLAIKWATWLFLGVGAGYLPPVPAGEETSLISGHSPRLWMIPVITALGGLISGLIVFKWAPEAEGHGTDAAINSFHNKDGFIRWRVPFIKLLASAITIGSGGSAGREGPVALIGAGFGSAIADVFKLNNNDRRIAMAVGIGAGIGSIFKAPLGGAILSTEILYRRDFEVEALLPSFIASITGYSIFASWHGWTPIFGFETGLTFQRPEELLGYLILGVACGIFGKLYGWSFYRIRNFFRTIPAPNYLKPAIGGLVVGVIAIFLPQVMGMGYGWLQLAIDGNFAALPLVIIIALIFGKIVATGFSIGSGGSGGVFAPGLVIGGMVGGALWYALHGVTTFVPSSPGAFVIVGMMAFFGGIAKAPLAIMIMVSEMTSSYALLAPCMLSVVVAYVLTGNSYIYEHQVNSKADSPAHRAEFSVPYLRKIKIKDAMVTRVITGSPNMLLTQVAELMKSNEIEAVPILREGSLVGIVANLDLVRAPESKWPQMTASEVMSKQLIVAYPDETLYDALTRMTR